jgi:hypothetical protein
MLFIASQWGGHRFVWDDRQWSFDQLTEAVSSVVPAQTIDGRYYGRPAREYVCGNEANPIVDKHLVYALTQYLVWKTRCDIGQMHDALGIALKEFVKTAPRL